MAVYRDAVLCTNGQKLLALAAGGEVKINFTTIKTSSTRYEAGQLQGLTDIGDVMQSVGISASTSDESLNTVTLYAAFSNVQLKEGYYIRNFGIYATDPEQGDREVLYAVVSADESTNPATYISAYNGKGTSGVDFSCEITVDNASEVTVTLDERASVPLSVFQDLADKVSDLQNKKSDKGHVHAMTDVTGLNDAISGLKTADSSNQKALDDYKASNGKEIDALKAADLADQKAFNDYKASNDGEIKNLKSADAKNEAALTDYKTANDGEIKNLKSADAKNEAALTDYKTANDKEIAALKAADASNQSALSDYKASNDKAVAALKDGKAEKVHTHTIGDVANLRAEIDAKADRTHSHDYVPTSRTVNGKALKADITLGVGDISGAASQSALEASETSLEKLISSKLPLAGGTVTGLLRADGGLALSEATTINPNPEAILTVDRFEQGGAVHWALVSDMCPMRNGGGTMEGLARFPGGTDVWIAGAGSYGKEGYALVATLTVRMPAADVPIAIELSARKRAEPASLAITFEDADGTDPGLKSFTYTNADYGAYMHRRAASTWDLYVRKSHAYDFVCVTGYRIPDYMKERVAVEWKDGLAETLPQAPAAAVKAAMGGAVKSVQDVAAPSSAAWQPALTGKDTRNNGTVYTLDTQDASENKGKYVKFGGIVHFAFAAKTSGTPNSYARAMYVRMPVAMPTSQALYPVGQAAWTIGGEAVAAQIDAPKCGAMSNQLMVPKEFAANTVIKASGWYMA